MIHIPENNEDLFAQCELETFTSSGPGGQNVNRRETAVRLRHRPTGLAVSCQDERSQHRNKTIALERLRRKLHSLNRRRKPRIPTRMSQKVRERILEHKKHHSRKKQERGKPVPEE